MSKCTFELEWKIRCDNEAIQFMLHTNFCLRAYCARCRLHLMLPELGVELTQEEYEIGTVLDE